MGYFDDIPKQGDTTKGNTGSTKTSSGFFSDIPVATKEPSTLSKIGTGAKAVGKGFIDMFVNPAEAQRNYEAQVLPQYYQGDSKILKALTAPGTAIARGALKTFSRVITPGLTPLTDDVAEIYEVSKKGGIADKISEGSLPPETLDDFKVLQKTGVNIVGDVAQAVLSFVGTGATAKTAGNVVKQPFKQAFKQGAIETAPIGALFGTATTASDLNENTTYQDVFTNIGLSTFMASVLGGIVSGAVPASKGVIKKVRDLAKLTPEEMTRLKVTSTGGTTNVPLNTPKTRFEKYNSQMGYEGYTPESELPVIEMGSKPKVTSDLPTIQMEAPKPRAVPGDIRYEAIPDVVKPIINEGKTSKAVLSEAQKVIRATPKQVPAEGRTVAPALATDVEKAAIQAKLVSRFEGLPEAKTMNMKQQASDAADLIARDYEYAKRVAMGQETPPGELRDASVFEAVKQKALDEGDVTTLRQLATESTIPTKLTAYGQEIKAADVASYSNDPVELMQEVVKARAKNRKAGAVKDELYRELRKSAPSKDDWVAFINGIEC